MTTKQEQALGGAREPSRNAGCRPFRRAAWNAWALRKEEFERVMLNALIRNPELQDVRPQFSLDVAVADCIQAGLLP